MERTTVGLQVSSLPVRVLLRAAADRGALGGLQMTLLPFGFGPNHKNEIMIFSLAVAMVGVSR